MRPSLFKNFKVFNPFNTFRSENVFLINGLRYFR